MRVKVQYRKAKTPTDTKNSADEEKSPIRYFLLGETLSLQLGISIKEVCSLINRERMRRMV